MPVAMPVAADHQAPPWRPSISKPERHRLPRQRRFAFNTRRVPLSHDLLARATGQEQPGAQPERLGDDPPRQERAGNCAKTASTPLSSCPLPRVSTWVSVTPVWWLRRDQVTPTLAMDAAWMTRGCRAASCHRSPSIAIDRHRSPAPRRAGPAGEPPVKTCSNAAVARANARRNVATLGPRSVPARSPLPAAPALRISGPQSCPHG
jgi:hypothetical protein